ncbi:MAG: alpha/beta hydrolase-fold protein [Candidatus Delongbacteria bacterium]
MKHLTLLLLCLLFWAPLRAQGFAEFLTDLLGRPVGERQAVVDSLFAHLPGGETPIREADGAWFIWRGTASSLAVAGDMTGWSPNLSLTLIAGTNLWERHFLCEADARLDYKLVRNGSEWILDPLNPHTCSGGFGPNSELAMPEYVQPQEIQNLGLPNGTLVSWPAFYSPQLNNTRTIQILLPPGYQEGQARPVCVVHDGSEYLTLGSLRNVVAWLADQHPNLELPIFVCVPPVNRTAEYHTTQQDLFAHFIVDTVLPAVRAQWATYDDPARWISLGASDGGNISTYLLGHFPAAFGRGVLMSPYIPAANRQALAQLSPDSLRVYLNWGSYDIEDIIQTSEPCVALLEERGVPHLARLYHEGHSWGLWRATLDEGLLYILEADTAVPPALPPAERGAGPERLELRAWPNPFNSQVQLELPPGPGRTRLRIFDSAGRLCEEHDAGGGRFIWEADALPSGRYWVEGVRAGRRALTSVTLLR